MAFSMNGMSAGFSSGMTSTSSKLSEGDTVSEIVTPALGFNTLSKRDAKIKVFEPWPEAAQPPSYASLLAVSSGHGLFVAGAPDSAVVGRTADVREAVYRSGDEEIRDCKTLNSISIARPTHLAFASDESCLVIATEQASELVAYSTQSLTTPSPQAALSLPTRAPVRSLIPNPEPSQASLFAVLNTNGELLLADLSKSELVATESGPVLATNVSCVTWSSKGKQLMVGKADGSAVQLKPNGSVVATTTKPSSIPDGCHLAQIIWLENEVFMFIYTLSTPDPGDLFTFDTYSFIVKTDKSRTEFVFHKFADEPILPDVPRGPTHIHYTRLRNYAPGLTELVIFASTVSSDVKIVTKASKSLSGNEASIDVYTSISTEPEGRLPTIPMLGATNTSPIGLAIDLSDDQPIISPLPADPEIEDSAVPLPELVSLGENGLMSIWAIVYEDAIRSKQPYHGFEDIQRLRANVSVTKADSTQTAPQAAPLLTAPKPEAPSVTSLQQSAFTTSMQNQGQQSSTFPKMSSPETAAFGQSTPIGGDKKSSWTNTGFGDGSSSTVGPFGQAPSFGSIPALGSNIKPAFGQTASPSTGVAFGQSGFGTKTGAAFGQAGFGTANNQASPFSTPTNTGSGFGAFASNSGGFASASKDTNEAGGFGKFGTGGGFATGVAASPFTTAQSSKPSIFNQPSTRAGFGNSNTFGTATSSSSFKQSGKSGFTLQSTFQRDSTSKDEQDPKDDSGAGFGFGGLGGMLGGSSSKIAENSSKELDMNDSGSEISKEDEVKPQVRETPPSTIAQSKATPTPHIHSLFGQPSTTPPTQPKAKVDTGFSFAGFSSTTPKAPPAPMASLFGTKPVTNDTPAAVQKSEPSRAFSFKRIDDRFSDSDRVKSLSDDEEEADEAKIPEAPLPPDPFSKPAFQTGDTSVSSLNSKGSKENDEPPLPPDFLPANKSATKTLKKEESEVPSEVLSSDLGEDSGEDITGDVSPVEGKESDAGEETENFGTSPESSFGRVSDHSPVASPMGGPFTKVSKPEQSKSTRPLFGELGQTGPILPPPQPKPQESPRSPSPMRKPSRQSLLPRSPERSFSAPARPRSILEQRKTDFKQSTFAAQAAKVRDEEIEMERARNEAARRAREAAAAAEMEPLVDDEDLILQQELAKPTEPSENLDPFVTIQPGKVMQESDNGRTDIPSQIEKLYQDINSMVVTLGINAKSLSAYMMYQAGQKPSQHWPSVLSSDTPMDALNDEWFLGDTDSLPKGIKTLETEVKNLEVKNVIQKLEGCQYLLTKEVTDLRSRITTLRRSTHAQPRPEQALHAPLSAEQVSIQQDLRKSSASVLNNLNEVEENLAVLRARLADMVPSKSGPDGFRTFGFGSNASKKPTVEAVMSTVSKLTSMAEKKSADIDVLEAQMRRLQLPSSDIRPSTPERPITKRSPSTPGSVTSSVFYTPGSKGSRSTRTTPSRHGQSLVSVEDKRKWQSKAKRRKDIADMLTKVLREKHAK